jgi:predicted transposase YdaD
MAAKRFDVTLKDLIEEYAAIWPMLAGPWPVRSVEVIDADIATLTGAADKVLLVHGTSDWIMNLELQAGHRLNLPDRMHLHSTALYHRHHILVRSMVVLLRREALASNLTGVLELRLPDESEPYDVFRYRVVRVWELPVERLMTGSLGLLPLAPLTDQAAGQLPRTLGRIEDRLRQEATPEEAQKLRTTIFVLLGLRYSREVAQKLFEGVTAMEESVTYQAIMEKGIEKGIPKGELREAQRLLQRLGRKRFGPPDPATIALIESLTDLDRLEQLSERVLEVSSWQELFR